MTKHKDLKSMPRRRIRLLLPLATILSHLVPAPATASVSNMPPLTSAPRSGCPSMCGDVNIPYPFGIGEGCSWPGADNFTVTCDHTYSPPRPSYYSVSKQPFEIINISVETGEMRIFSGFSYICFNSSNTIEEASGWQLNYTKSPFLVSPTRNQFTAIGGNTLAFMEGREDFSYYTACVTSSITLEAAAQDGDDCTGLGCCQTMVAGNLSYVHMFWISNLLGRITINNAWRYSPCGYAFLAEKGWYKFKQRDLLRDGNDTFASRVGTRSIPVVLDWAIRDGSCQSASACVSSNSYCVNATQGPGYLCNCSKGCTGNPYVPDGCKNINECELRKSNLEKYGELYPCHSGGTCHDTEGDYICTCGFGLRGDGKSDTGCHPIFPVYTIAIFVNRPTTSKGAFGKVFKGTTDDNQLVAVKRSHKQGKDIGKRENNLQQGDDIVTEITFQFGTSHPNLVRLVGCCLETNIPVLVFEFISKGSLYKLLHEATHEVLCLTTRLGIAIGSAEALAYIHSNGDRIHGDIKSANILLDDNLKPKVSDFGSSKILSVDMYARAVAADMSYIDPVYMKTEHFVPKSDVYSFSVVLLELIIRKTVKYGENKTNSLPMDFVKSCKELGNGRVMYDKDILSHDDGAQCQHCMECLDKIGSLAVRCLKEDVDERPTMAEVMDELKEAAKVVDKCKQ